MGVVRASNDPGRAAVAGNKVGARVKRGPIGTC